MLDLCVRHHLCAHSYCQERRRQLVGHREIGSMQAMPKRRGHRTGTRRAFVPIAGFVPRVGIESSAEAAATGWAPAGPAVRW